MRSKWSGMTGCFRYRPVFLLVPDFAACRSRRRRRERVGTAEAVVMHRRNIEAKKASRCEVKNR